MWLIIFKCNFNYPNMHKYPYIWTHTYICICPHYYYRTLHQDFMKSFVCKSPLHLYRFGKHSTSIKTSNEYQISVGGMARHSLVRTDIHTLAHSRQSTKRKPTLTRKLHGIITKITFPPIISSTGNAKKSSLTQLQQQQQQQRNYTILLKSVATSHTRGSNNKHQPCQQQKVNYSI